MSVNTTLNKQRVCDPMPITWHHHKLPSVLCIFKTRTQFCHGTIFTPFIL